jgi:hypothetical protein
LISRSLQPVCQRHAHTLSPRRVGPLRGRHGHYRHVSAAETARKLTVNIRQRPTTVASRVENCHKRIQELRDHLRKSLRPIYPAPNSYTFRGTNQMGRHNPLSWGDP